MNRNGYRRARWTVSFAGAALVLCALGPLGALPPFVPLEQRAQEAKIVIIGQVVKVTSTGLNQASRAASIQIRVESVLKGKQPPKEFSVNFIVFPGSYENQLRRPPAPGKYFLFLDVMKVRDSSGRSGRVVVLYRPHPFSYAKFTSKNMRIIQAAIPPE